MRQAIILLGALILAATPALSGGGSQATAPAVAGGEPQTARLCDDNDENCIEVPGIRVTGPGVQVLYVGADEDAPQFVPISRFMAPRGYLGVSLTDLTPELQRHFGVDGEMGVLVSRVEAGSPAESAGVRVGDVITLVDGEAMRSGADVARGVRDKEAGDGIDIEVWRDGRPLTLSATAAVRDKAQWDVSGLSAGDLQFSPKHWQAIVEHSLQGLEGLKGLEGLEQIEGSDGRYVFRFDPESAAKWGERLNAYFNSEAFTSQAKRMQGLEGDLTRRIHELEKRLQELEQELQDDGR